MAFLVTNGHGVYVKRTCTRYGPFYGGRLQVTEDRADARLWTRRRDAEQFAKVVVYKAQTPQYVSFNQRERDFIAKGLVQIQDKDGRFAVNVWKAALESNSNQGNENEEL